MSQQTDNTDNFEMKNESGDHITEHEYDGIKELDNPPPKWIMAIFYITIAFAFYYGIYYFVLDGPSQDEEYTIKSAEHDKKFSEMNSDQAPLVLLTDEQSVSEGKAIYAEMNCKVCHGEVGEGNAVGPNLTDQYWLHGCDFNSVFNIIKNGVPTKGMTAFKSQMSDAKIQKVTSYVLKGLVGTNPSNPKDAQGKECK